MSNAEKAADSRMSGMLNQTVARWRAWTSASPLRRLGHEALVAAGTSTFARVMAFLKEVVVAASFGLSDSLDVYLVAFVLISMPLGMLLNAVQTTLIAHLAGITDAEAAASRFIAACLLTLAALAVMLPVWLLFLPHALPWMASGFPPDKRQTLEAALYWLIPYYFLNGFNLLAYGALQARRRFFVNGLLPAITPVVIMLGVLGWGVTGDWHVLVASLAIGFAIESALLLAMLARLRLLAWPGLYWHALARPIIGASLALIPGTLATAIGPAVEQAIAAALGEGSNAALAYGYKLPAALQTIVVTAIGITSLPFFATQLAQGKAAYGLHSLNKLAIVLVAGGIVLVAPLAFFSNDIVSLLYQRGAFDATATSRVAPIQFAYFIQVPFALLAMLGIKTLAALRLNGWLSFYTVMAVLLQSLLAYMLAGRLGPAGIAWAAVAGSALLGLVTYLTARVALRRKITK
jgi:putative peptidoglycan lipid II flippase